MRVGALERLEAVVELMVPERRDRVVKPIHGGDHGVNRGRVPDDRVSGEVAERSALENVAVVEQQGVGTFAARLRDQTRGPREADGIIRTITIVIVRVKIGVQIGQAKQTQAQPGLGACGRGFHGILPATR